MHAAANHGGATPWIAAETGCGMLPDIRFAIGAVLAGALLIVTALGLAAAVRIAHHQSATPLDGARPFAYAEPVGAPLEREMAARELSDRALAAVELVPPAETAPKAAPAETADAPQAPVRAEIVTMIPVAAAAEPAPEATPAETPAITVADEPAEQVAALPPAAEEKVAPSAEPPPAATPPMPAQTPAVKAKKVRKKLERKRLRVRTVVRQPGANTRYPGGENGLELLFLPHDRAPSERTRTAD